MTEPVVLEALVAEIQEVCKRGLADVSLVPTQDLLVQEIVDKFSQEENDYGPRQWSQKELLQENWSFASHKVAEAVKEKPQFKEVLASAKASAAPGVSVDSLLEAFVRHVANRFLRRLGGVAEAAEIFSRDLRDEPPEGLSTATLEGVVVLAAPVEVAVPDARIRLRPMLKEDYERTRLASYAIEPPFGGLSFRMPTAMLEVTMRSHGGAEIQAVVDRSCRVLNLFRPGSVKLDSLSFGARGFLGWGGTVRPGLTNPAFNRWALKVEAVDKLRQHWRAIWPRIPSAYDPDHRDSAWNIAYGRYQEAMTAIGWEAKMASAVMGLEGLLLGDEEKAELTYKFSMRLAKIMAAGGRPVSKVVRDAKEAYGLRSLHVHGGRLSHRQKRRLEQQYGSLESLFQQTADWLRLLLLLYLLANVDKEEFVDALDDSMLTAKSHESLVGRLSGWATLAF